MKKNLLPRHIFLRKFLNNLLLGALITFCSLFLGMAGYHYFDGLSWLDSFENAAMILSGMGPVEHSSTDAGKAFAGFYALFSGIIFLVVIAIIFAPLIHRFFHQFHIDDTKK